MPEVFGRASELASADSFIESTGQRHGLLLLEGAAGIGKTTVWREVTRRAEERGFRVLSCRPAEAEAKLAMSAVADLFEPVAGGALSGLPDPQRRAFEVALLRAEPDAGALDARVLATAVRSLVAELSARRPLLLAIDDVQWLDATSAAVLEFALRRPENSRPGGAPLRWLFARRVPEPARLRPDTLVPPESLTRVTVGPLEAAALHDVLRDRLGRSLSRPLLARVHQAAGGNPFYALEIARELLASGEPPIAGAALPVPDDLRELVARRLRRLPRDTREALLTAAALSNPTTAIVDEAALAAAEEQDIARIDEHGRVAFQHPLYASALYHAAPRAHRRRLHARLAELVGDEEESARHLALATAAPDEQVARKLETGAALARSRGAWGSAAELLELARRVTPPARLEDAHRRVIAAAEHHSHAGDRSRARALLEEIVTEPLQPSTRALALTALGDISYNDENFEEAHRLFTEAREAADDPSLALRIELGIAYVRSNLWDFHGGAEHAYRALELADEVEEAPLVAQALAYCAMFDYLCGRGVDWDKVARSVELEDPDLIVPLQSRPSVIAACLTLYAGQLSDARERFDATTSVARERDDESDLSFIMLWRSWLETRAGNLAEAASLADEAASLATLSGSDSMHAWSLTQRALVHAHRGEIAETRRGCEEAASLVERSGNRLPTIWIAASLALVELSLGDPEAAWRACEPLTGALEEQGVGEPIVPFFLPEALEALIGIGELGRAEALLDAFEAQGRRLDRAWALATAGRCRALLLAARRDLAGAESALEGALAEHERLEMPFEQARTLLVRGAIDRRVRRRKRARESFERALATFENMGADLWAERARQELERVALRRSTGNELTAAERRVAELAAQGLTNREVAAALFISPKTVEAALARTYRKLGIASRAELGARMSGA